ncbi:hypothetical protein, partial [Burkholderia pseudomallei]
MLDADPTVFIFCERPGYVQVDGHQHLADFWGCYVNLNDLVILNDSLFIDDTTKACHDLEGQALSIPRVASAELAAT